MTKPNPRVLEVKGVFVEPASAASIGGAIRDIKAGKIIIVVDDEDRENEGDFIISSEKATIEDIVNDFGIRYKSD